MEKRLARGLDALMGRGTPPPATVRDEAGTPLEILVSSVRANPDQPRTEFIEASIRELADSIAAHGLLQPIVVRRDGDGYVLVAGERRLRAFRALGKERIPAIVRALPHSDQLVLALIENIQRENLNAIEEAQAYGRLLHEFGLTHDQVAEKVGKERSTVSNSLRLLDLPEAAADAVSRGTISAGHGRALLPVAKRPDFDLLLTQVIRDGLSVRATEALVRGLVSGKSGGTTRTELRREPSATEAACEEIASRLKAKWNVTVEVHSKDLRGGDIVFRCASRREFDHLMEQLENASLPPRQSGSRFNEFELE